MTTCTAWVTRAIDGDTIGVRVIRLTRRIRLYNINAPEIDTHDALESINYLARNA